MNATPEQAAALRALLDTWEERLTDLSARPELAATLAPQKRILATYRRTLGRDLSRGIERVPAGELFRATATVNASLAQLEALGVQPEPSEPR